MFLVKQICIFFIFYSLPNLLLSYKMEESYSVQKTHMINYFSMSTQMCLFHVCSTIWSFVLNLGWPFSLHFCSFYKSKCVSDRWT